MKNEKTGESEEGEPTKLMTYNAFSAYHTSSEIREALSF